MRKLRLKLDELQVETFDTAGGKGAGGGTVRANESDSIDSPCTRGESCYVELCQDEGTNERACYTPYIDCYTVRWICFTEPEEDCV